eukprot:TRINITY_DN3137_c1_g1_i4.p1 TRINITY_DN3137_c1_g1~~TRINITY_DN3137_c1_g1_i4.p1  ORF type:complete len:443 (+),score=199.94 TRINITY_DN3137_c1_g1_i4:79-1329(+)
MMKCENVVPHTTERTACSPPLYQEAPLEFYLTFQSSFGAQAPFALPVHSQPHYLIVNPKTTVARLCHDLAQKLNVQSPFRLTLDGKTLQNEHTVTQSGMHQGCQVFLALRYLNVGKIGEGTFGRVFKVFDHWTGDHVAMKQIKSEYAHEGVPSFAFREISALKDLEHPNVVRLLDVSVVEKGKLNLYFELLGHDLREYIKANGTVAPARVVSITHQILQGLRHCHDCRVVHRDLKPHNILLSSDGSTVKIADFGLARAFEYPMRQLTAETVTLWYRAPELLLGLRNYTPLVDMWSVGAIMGEMSKGQPLFPGECEVDAMFKIFRLLGTPTADEWAGVAALPHFRRQFPKWTPANLRTHFPAMDVLALDLLKKMLKLDPEQRYSPDQALRHPYFNSHKVHKLRQQAAAPQQQMVHAP